MPTLLLWMFERFPLARQTLPPPQHGEAATTLSPAWPGSQFYRHDLVGREKSANASDSTLVFFPIMRTHSQYVEDRRH